MPEKRRLARLKKRLKILFGAKEPTQIAFTEDFNEAGVFIKCVNVHIPGSTMVVDIYMPDNEPVRFEGKVMWSKRVPGSLIHFAKKGGMGIKILKFLTNEEKYRAYCCTIAEERRGHSRPQPQSPPVKR